MKAAFLRKTEQTEYMETIQGLMRCREAQSIIPVDTKSIALWKVKGV